MRFTDPNIRLTINGIQFKAYLQDSDVSHETKEHALPFSPLSFTNDAMATRVTQKAKFTFNVFSETRLECIQNYRNLLILINSIKPMYDKIEDQYVPNVANVTGLVNVAFKGLPGRDFARLHLNNFSYNINKDIGYIEVPYSEIKDPRKPSFYDKNSGMKLIPLAYTISMEGKILLQFEETARVRDLTLKRKSVNMQDILSKANIPEGVNSPLIPLYQKIFKRSIYMVEDNDKIGQILTQLQELRNKKLVDEQGNVVPLNEGQADRRYELDTNAPQNQEEYNELLRLNELAQSNTETYNQTIATIRSIK